MAIGAVGLLLIASAATYVSKNAKRLKGGDRDVNHSDDAPSLQYSNSFSDSGDEIDKYANDKERPSGNFFAQNSVKNNHQDDGNTDMVEIDLEDGRGCKQAEVSGAESSIDFNSIANDAKQKGLMSKIFKRKQIGAEIQPMSWMDIRNDGSPACSSGCEPAKGGNSISSLSPKFSPFNKLSSVRMAMQSLVSVSSDESDDLPSVEERSTDGNNVSLDDRKTNIINIETTTADRQERIISSSVYNRIQQKTLQSNENALADSPSSIFSGLGELEPEQDMSKLKNIFENMKTRGSYEESFITTSSSGTSVTEFKSKAKARLGLNQVQVHQSTSSHSQESIRTRHEINTQSQDITFEEELLMRANNGSCVGLNFGHVFSDQRNNAYECRVPSGPLGIVVKSTQVGLEVQKIKPLSTLCNKISIGDIIIAVDEVDLVGVDVSVFWQLVSRRANKQQRCFVILRV